MINSFNTPSGVGDPSEFPLPYGKHAGTPLSGAPTQYLRYIYTNHDFTYNPELQRAIEAYLALR
jgi:hypothetical protein